MQKYKQKIVEFYIIKNFRFVEKFGQLATNLMKINKEIFATNFENLYLLQELLSKFNISRKICIFDRMDHKGCRMIPINMFY